MAKKKLKQLFEAAGADPKRKFFALEMMMDGDLGTALPEQEMDVPEAMSSDEQLREAFKTLIMAVLDDTSLSLEDMSDKIVALLTVQADAEEALTGKAPSGGSGDGSGSGDGGDSKAKEPPPAAESVAAQGAGAGTGVGAGAAAAAAAASAQGTDRAAAILESATLLAGAEGGPLTASAAILEAMAALPTKERRQAFVAEMAANRPASRQGATLESQAPAPGAPGSVAAPRSAAPPAGSTGSVAETAAAQTVETKYKEPGSFTRALRGVA